jgi:DNA polymerase-1
VVKAYVADHKEFNPLSDRDTLTVFKDYLKRPEVLVEDKHGKSRYSTDKNVLDKIEHPLAKLIVTMRNRTKLKSTYVDCFELGKGSSIWPDGKLHTSFNTTFAETGRTSSDEPNMKNFPKRNDAWVRRQVIAPKGYTMVAVDYGQLEGCTGAMCTKDKYLVDALWNEYDMHMEWAEKLVHEYPDWVGNDDFKDKAVAKKYRSIAKNKLVFPAFFGATDESISGYLKIPVENIKTVMDEFWSTFTGFRSWQEKLMKRYYDTGLVASPTGRLHRYPLTRNQAINFPIQSVACDIVSRGMNTLSELAVEEQAWHLHPILNIHDDLSFMVPDDDKIIEESIDTIYRVMLSPGYDFINVPLSVSCSIGKHWFQMEELGKFWSHKDL